MWNVTRSLIFLSLGIAAALVVPSNSHAGDPVAVVGDIKGGSPDVEIFEFLETGRKISLTRHASIVIGYFRSCRWEKITGGEIVVGTRKSRIIGGRMTAEIVECDGGNMNISAELAAKSAVTVFREAPSTNDKRIPRPSITVYSLNPLFALSAAGGPISLKRLDAEEPASRLTADSKTIDLLTLRINLAPGGIYAAKHGTARTVFQVDPLAENGGAAISRLVPLIN